MLQCVANCCRYTPALVVLMNIKPVQIAGFIHVTEADDLTVHLRHHCVVRPKGFVPRFQIYLRYYKLELDYIPKM